MSGGPRRGAGGVGRGPRARGLREDGGAERVVGGGQRRAGGGGEGGGRGRDEQQPAADGGGEGGAPEGGAELRPQLGQQHQAGVEVAVEGEAAHRSVADQARRALLAQARGRGAQQGGVGEAAQVGVEPAQQPQAGGQLVGEGDEEALAERDQGRARVFEQRGPGLGGGAQDGHQGRGAGGGLGREQGGLEAVEGGGGAVGVRDQQQVVQAQAGFAAVGQGGDELQGPGGDDLVRPEADGEPGQGGRGEGLRAELGQAGPPGARVIRPRPSGPLEPAMSAAISTLWLLWGAAPALAQEAPEAGPPAEAPGRAADPASNIQRTEEPVSLPPAPAEGPPPPRTDIELHGEIDGELLPAGPAVDPLAPRAEREAAVRALGAAGDPGLPFLRAVAVGPDSAVAVALFAQLGAVAAAAGQDEALQLAGLGVRRGAELAVQRAAVEATAGLGVPAAGEALRGWAEDPALPTELRRAADAAWRAAFPDQAAKGGGWRGSPVLSVALGAGAAGLTTGAVLGGVGVAADNNLATGIGYVAGGLAGAGAGALWARSEQLSVDDGLLLQAATAWGVAEGAMLAWALVPEGAAASAGGRAAHGLLPAAGALAGGGVGLLRAKRGPVHGVDSLGTTALGLGGLLLGAGIDSARPPYEDGEVYDTNNYDPGPYLRHRSVGHALRAGGAALGLGVGVALESVWEPTPTDMALWGLGAAVGAIAAPDLGGTVLGEAPAWDRAVRPATTAAVGLGAMAAVGGAMDLSPSAVGLTAWSAGVGGLGLAGLGGLVDLPRSWGGAAFGRSLGVIGGSAWGLVTHRDTRLAAGDLTLLGLGAPISFLWAGGWGSRAVDREIVYANGQIAYTRPGPSITALGGAAATGALTGVARAVDADPARVLLTASGAAWGAWLGAMGGLAAGMDDEDVLIPTLASSHGLALAAGLGAFLPGGVDPARTVRPQLVALGGGTLGALGGALAGGGAFETQPVGLGALVGTAAGAAGGALWELSRDPGPARSAARDRPPARRAGLPGVAQLQAAPWAIDGEAGWGLTWQQAGW